MRHGETSGVPDLLVQLGPDPELANVDADMSTWVDHDDDDPIDEDDAGVG